VSLRPARIRAWCHSVLGAVLLAGSLSCMAPVLPDQDGPYRDSFPVDELWVVNGLSETIGLCNLQRLEADVLPWNANPLFLTGRVPNRIVIDGTNGLVVNSSGNSITVFALRQPGRQREYRLPTGSNPWDARFIHRPGRSLIAVTSFLRNSLFILDAATGESLRELLFPEGTRPQGMALSGSDLWIALSGWNFSTGEYDPGRIIVLETADPDPLLWTIRHILAVRPNPQEILPDLAGQIHVLSTGRYGKNEGCLQVFDAAAGLLKKEILTGGSPRSLALDPVNGNLHLAGGDLYRCYATGTLEPVALPTISDAVTGKDIAALAIAADRRMLFAADFANDRILALSLDDAGVLREIPAGDGPLALAAGKTW